MRFDLFVEMIKHYIILSVGIKYFCVTYFLTSITMPDLQSSDVSHTVNDVSAPSGISLI